METHAILVVLVLVAMQCACLGWLFYLDRHEQNIRAYHESGHAVVCRALLGIELLKELSIVASDKAAGHLTCRVSNTRDVSVKYITVAVAGDVAQRLRYSRSQFRARDDYEIVRKLVLEWISKEPRAAGAYVRSAELEARLILERNWKVVQQLTAELKRSKTLNEEALQQFFRERELV